MVDLKAAVELIRPVNCLMIGLAVVVGEVIGQRTVFTSSTLLGFMAGFLLGGASMVNNDYLDRNVDAVNAPSRPLPSGRVSPSEACMLMILLSACGLVLALLTSLLSFFIAVAGLIVFLLYNYYGKKLGLIGNMMVSVGTVLSLLYGAFLGEDFMTLISSSQRMSLLALFGLMVFLSNTGREVNKGIADVEGDKLRGVKTVAVEQGPRAASIVAAVFYTLAVVVSFIPWLLGLVAWWYLPIVIAANIGFEVSAFILLHDYSRKNALRVKRIVLAWMLLGLIAFAVGVL